MATRISRRTLLANGSRAALAIAAVLPCATSRASHVDRQGLRLAAIGVGNRGADNLIELEGANVVALCDVDDRYLQAALRRFPSAKPYQDYRRLLDEQQLDAVVISTPDHSHVGPALSAMRRGCHVFCEKPLAHNLQETQLLRRVAAEGGRVTQVANQHRASAGYRRARQLIKAGVLGTIQSIHGWTLRPYWPQGIARPATRQPVPDYLNWDLWLGAAAMRPYHETYHPFSWRGWWDFGCGALGDMGTHLLDPVLTALKLDTPHSIDAQSSDDINEESLPSWSIIRYTFAMKDPDRDIELVWYDGGKLPPQELTGADRLPDEGVLVIGERGKLYVPPLGKQPFLTPAALLNEAPPADDVPDSPGHIRQWLDACRRGEPQRCDTPFVDGARLTDLCLLGKLALRVGRRIEWDAATEQPVNCPDCAPWLTREYREGWEIDA